LAQYLAGPSIDEVQLSAGKASDRFVLAFGDIWVVVPVVSDLETCLRANESEIGCPDGSNTHTAEPL
jgi:hypothetical protein